MNQQYTTACIDVINELEALAEMEPDDWGEPKYLMVDQEHYDGLVSEWRIARERNNWALSMSDGVFPATFMGCTLILSPTVDGVCAGF